MSRERILVVDDNRSIREFIKDMILQPNGFTALTASDGLDGLRKVRAQVPDLILLDLQMPRMDGLEVLDVLNAEQFDIPVILMTGHGSEAIAVEVFRKGVKDYIIKGDAAFTAEIILGRIERSLTEVRLRREKEQLYDDLVIRNADLKRRFQELKVLYHVGRSVTALMDINNLMQRIIGAATILTGSEEGAAFVMENGQLMCRAIKRQGDERPYAVNTPMVEPLAVHCIETAQMVSFAPEGATIGRANGFAPSSVKALATPMIYGGQTIGALVVKNVSSEASPYSDHHGALLSSLADYAAIAYKTQGQVRTDDALPPTHVKPRSVFLSYRRSDYEEHVKPLVEMLRDNGMNVWIDQSSLEGGHEWLDKVTRALDECSVMVLCVSPEAIQSRWVRMEYHYFILEEKPIIPVICRPTRLPADLAGLQAFRNTETNILIERLLLVLKK